jgi:hypothetical protein
VTSGLICRFRATHYPILRNWKLWWQLTTTPGTLVQQPTAAAMPWCHHSAIPAGQPSAKVTMVTSMTPQEVVWHVRLPLYLLSFSPPGTYVNISRVQWESWFFCAWFKLCAGSARLQVYANTQTTVSSDHVLKWRRNNCCLACCSCMDRVWSRCTDRSVTNTNRKHRKRTNYIHISKNEPPWWREGSAAVNCSLLPAPLSPPFCKSTARNVLRLTLDFSNRVQQRESYPGLQGLLLWLGSQRCFDHGCLQMMGIHF